MEEVHKSGYRVCTAGPHFSQITIENKYTKIATALVYYRSSSIMFEGSSSNAFHVFENRATVAPSITR